LNDQWKLIRDQFSVNTIVNEFTNILYVVVD
jgi:hypothetical protein